jgi:hypothetical protein
MFGIATHRRRQTARGLIVLLLGLWAMIAVAPCTMAAPTCHDMSAPCVHTGDSPSPSAPDSNCEALQAADCQTRDAGWLAGYTTTPDFAVLPPQHFLYPQAALIPFHNTLPHAERYVLRLSSPPLYLQHGVFLI